MGRLLLVDGLNVVRRIYEANPAPDSEEKAQAAVRASIGSFRRAREEHSPTHSLVAFDYGGQTWRHQLFPDYKKSRKPMPEQLRAVIPQIVEALDGLGLRSITVPGVEAEDVFATVSRVWAKTKQDDVVVLSTDKDLAALIAEGARVYDHFKPEWRDEAWVMERFGVPACLLQDSLALTGDQADDIPGVEKVGVKTAAAWLTQYGCLESVIRAAGELKGKAGANFRSQIDRARLSRALVGFKTDLSLGLTWNMLRVEGGI